MTIKIFVASDCGPCQELKQSIERGELQASEGIEVIEIDKNPDGYQQFLREAVQDGQGVVPTAMREGDKCQVLVDKETNRLTIQCPEPGEEVTNPINETPEV